MDELWTTARGSMTKFEFQDLTEEELLSAISLLQLLAASDGEISDGEAREMRLFADEIGADHYDELNKKLAELQLSEDGVKALANGIHRQGARQLIFGELFELAIVGSINAAEDKLLKWLKLTWELES